jgi:thiol:disulfide interchange protein DsbA
VKIRILSMLLTLVLAAACSDAQQSDTATTAPAATTTVAQAAQDEAPVAPQTARTETPAAQDATPASEQIADPADAAAAAQAQAAAEDMIAAAGYRNGEHFERLSPTQPTSSGPDQVEVAEFFMYSCIHCYNFEPYVQQWLSSKADYVNFVRVPTVWNPAVRMHAQAFYAAEALGKGEEMHAPFFREMHVVGNYLQSKDAIRSFFGQFGVGADDFEGAFESFSVHAKLQRADELARRYRVDSTPTVVINGKYRTNASMAGGYDELLELINTLAASERARD